MEIKHHSDRKGFKSVDLTMIALARGYATYLCYMSLRKSETAFYEHLLRSPFIELAQARQWEYECEFNLAPSDARKRIDYVLAYNKQIIGIEAKYRRYKSKDLTIDLKNDLEKLVEIFPELPRVRPFQNKYMFIVVAAPKPIFNDLKLKKLPKKHIVEIDEKSLKEFGNKKNIFNQWDHFVTSSRVGKKEFCVRIIKVGADWSSPQTGQS